LDQPAKFRPDILLIPGTIAFDAELQPLDAKVYGIVYWLEHLKDGRCYASNSTIAEVAGSSASGVANSLNRLRDRGYIHCSYDDKNQRTGIVTLVRMSKTPYSNEVPPLTQMSNKGSNIKEKNITSEMQSQVKKIYGLYLANFKIDPLTYAEATEEEQRSLLQAASNRYRLTDKRRDKILARIKDCGYAATKQAVVNIGRSDFHRGINDREWSADLEWIMKSYEKVEEWANKDEARV
jgi:DNA-binding Lrp family transcriptional regulator